MKATKEFPTIHVLTANGLNVLTSTTDRAAAKLLRQVELFGLVRLTAKEATDKAYRTLSKAFFNGTPMFYVWLDAVDDAATRSVYLTEDAARADIARLEADDKEAGIYEPDAYSIINAAPYFA